MGEYLHSKIFDCCIREYYFYVTVLLESIDLFIVLLKGGQFAPNTEPHPCIHHCVNSITAIMCIGPCSLGCLFF